MPKQALNEIGASGTRRLSVSLSIEQHADLQRIATKNKVSVAWVVGERLLVALLLCGHHGGRIKYHEVEFTSLVKQGAESLSHLTGSR